MPISKSARRALRSATKKTLINRRRKAVLRSALKTAANETVNKTVSTIDKAAKWGIIHPNKAARLKSGLAKKFSSTASESKPKAATKAKAPKKPATTAKTKKPAKSKKPSA